MKIARIRTPAGEVFHAEPQPDGSYRVITGDLFASPRVTDRTLPSAKLLAPLVPVNILAIGLNYRKHAAEGGKGPPERPILFLKATSALQHPGDPIQLPRRHLSAEVDYEAELAVVIGRSAKDVPRERALDYVLGYTCANDVSAREWQRRMGGGQWCQAKSFDTFCPLGPWLVTADEISNPNALRLRCLLNGAVMQDWTTSDMIFDVATLIEFLSAGKTLLPGTVILTGTPHGVGFARTPPVFLQPGDTVSVEIERLGTLTNPVVAEPR